MPITLKLLALTPQYPSAVEMSLIAAPDPTPAVVDTTTALFLNIHFLGLCDIQYVKVRSIKDFIGAEALKQ